MFRISVRITTSSCPIPIRWKANDENEREVLSLLIACLGNDAAGIIAGNGQISVKLVSHAPTYVLIHLFSVVPEASSLVLFVFCLVTWHRRRAAGWHRLGLHPTLVYPWSLSACLSRQEFTTYISKSFPRRDSIKMKRKITILERVTFGWNFFRLLEVNWPAEFYMKTSNKTMVISA